MSRETLNLQGMNFLVADSNAYICSTCQSILRGFGATKIYEARNASDVERVLEEQRIDFLLCDLTLPPAGGLELTRAIRWNDATEYHKVPILVLTADTRIQTIGEARDAGANMVVSKPISVNKLYTRLAWVVKRRRRFIESSRYRGPDRRFKSGGYHGPLRRREDQAQDGVGAADRPANAEDFAESTQKA